MSKLSQERIRVLNRFETDDSNWGFGAFEAALEQEMGRRYGNYQTAKSTIAMAYKEGLFPETVKRYVLTNFAALGNSPAELTDICNELLSDMSPAEKESYGIKK